MNKLENKQIEFLDKYTFNGTWKLNPETGLVDVAGNFSCAYRELKDFLGIRFGNIRGYFNCSNNQLVSLEGSPQEVQGSFDCSHNKLVSLEGSPKRVGKNFYCDSNKLVSLKGAPQEIGMDLTCDAITLRGCPIDLLDEIYFYNNKKYFKLNGYITMIINGLDHEIYFKKMI